MDKSENKPKYHYELTKEEEVAMLDLARIYLGWDRINTKELLKNGNTKRDI